MTEQPMQGGYRRPANPAPVSGPGAMSQRTDGQPARYMSGGQYGEGQELMEMQTSAPMSESGTSAPSVRPSAGRGRASAAGGSTGGVTGLFAPSERPDEPITAGMPFGAGENPMEPTRQPKPYDLAIVDKYLPAMRQAAAMEGAPDRFRALVRYLQGVQK